MVCKSTPYLKVVKDFFKKTTKPVVVTLQANSSLSLNSTILVSGANSSNSSITKITTKITTTKKVLTKLKKTTPVVTAKPAASIQPRAFFNSMPQPIPDHYQYLMHILDIIQKPESFYLQNLTNDEKYNFLLAMQTLPSFLQTVKTPFEYFFNAYSLYLQNNLAFLQQPIFADKGLEETAEINKVFETLPALIKKINDPLEAIDDLSKNYIEQTVNFLAQSKYVSKSQQNRGLKSGAVKNSQQSLLSKVLNLMKVVEMEPELIQKVSNPLDELHQIMNDYFSDFVGSIHQQKSFASTKMREKEQLYQYDAAIKKLPFLFQQFEQPIQLIQTASLSYINKLNEFLNKTTNLALVGMSLPEANAVKVVLQKMMDPDLVRKLQESSLLSLNQPMIQNLILNLPNSSGKMNDTNLLLDAMAINREITNFVNGLHTNNQNRKRRSALFSARPTFPFLMFDLNRIYDLNIDQKYNCLIAMQTLPNYLQSLQSPFEYIQEQYSLYLKNYLSFLSQPKVNSRTLEQEQLYHVNLAFNQIPVLIEKIREPLNKIITLSQVYMNQTQTFLNPVEYKKVVNY